ncbi:hypothetical protein DWS21_21010, partial [Escherichia coli]|nr:hypothetical protein [Escherichia coli]
PVSYADIFSVPETAFYIYKWQAKIVTIDCQVVFTTLFGETAGNEFINIFHSNAPPFFWWLPKVFMK